MKFTLKALLILVAAIAVVVCIGLVFHSTYENGRKAGYAAGFNAQWRPNGELPNPEHEYPMGYPSDRGVTLFDKDGTPYWHLYFNLYPSDDGHWHIQHRPASAACGGIYRGKPDGTYEFDYEGCGFHCHIEPDALKQLTGQEIKIVEYFPPRDGSRLDLQ